MKNKKVTYLFVVEEQKKHPLNLDLDLWREILLRLVQLRPHVCSYLVHLVQKGSIKNRKGPAFD